MSSSLLPSNDSGIVNSMTRREIIFFIADAKKIDDPHKNSPGRRKVDRPSEVQRRFRITADGDMFLNEKSFSWTKSTTGVKGTGYPTMSLRTRKEQKKKAKTENGSSGPSKREKAPSCARVLVHNVMWRFWNGFEKIPKGMEVSHLTGVTAVGKKNLCCEDGVRNKHRIGCHGKTIPGESCKCGVPSKGIPSCRVVQVPSSSSFFNLNEQEKAVRDEKAALKALPSSGEFCKVCFCVKKEDVDPDNCPIDHVLDFCMCDMQSSLCDTPGCGNPAFEDDDGEDEDEVVELD